MATTKDLTVGEPGKVLRRFCLPMFGSIIFQQLYNLADSFVAGKMIGEEALAAVGNSYEITLIFIAFAFGCNMGCSVTVSQLFGAKKFTDMKTAVYTSLISTGAICAVLMAAGIMTSDTLLRLIQTPENILPDSLLYLNIYIFSLPFVFFYNVATGIFAALGDSKTPFIFLAASSTVNVAMDILFVSAFGMGVAGVAWATFICQGASCILAMTVVLKRLSGIETDGKAKLFSAKLLGRIASIAVPSVLQQSFISVGNILIQGVINGFGSGTIAGYAAAVKLNNLMITSLTTLANGVSNFTAQNIGAGKHERVNAGFRAALKLVWAISLPIALLYFFAGEPLVRFFMDHSCGKARRGRGAARCGTYVVLHGGDIHRPDTARCARVRAFGTVRLNGYMGGMADRLVHRHGTFRYVLYPRICAQVSRFPVILRSGNTFTPFCPSAGAE